jgi:hypothetical protein
LNALYLSTFTLDVKGGETGAAVQPLLLACRHASV